MEDILCRDVVISCHLIEVEYTVIMHHSQIKLDLKLDQFILWPVENIDQIVNAKL